MNKANYILLLFFMLIFNLIQAQDAKEAKFNIMAYGGIGYGIVENDNEPNYNLNSNNGGILLNYNINQKFGIATGGYFGSICATDFGRLVPVVSV
ncbi:hypothetical protein [Paucihalobacter sp.]|uniref:hypothetical protein n=1 Tax=Paucihalobacter sp. TaxID=2850405 RepID=UPI003D161437